MAKEDPTRTLAAWKKECLQVLQAIHPDYRLNREVKGIFFEFVRPGARRELSVTEFSEEGGVV